MMAAIGVAALCCAAVRVESGPAISTCIVAACVWYLTYRRFAQAMAHREAEGLTTSRSQKARILARCAIFALVVIGLSDAAFLAGYFGYMIYIDNTVRMTDIVEFPHEELEHIAKGTVCGIILALCAAGFLKWILWPLIRPPASAAPLPRGPILSPSEPERIPTHS
jgi:hypothetical protein